MRGRSRRSATGYEPYALLVPSQDPKFRAKFVAAVHEIFADGTAAGRFAHHFPGLQRSTALTMLYRINSIPSHRQIRSNDDDEENPENPSGEELYSEKY